MIPHKDIEEYFKTQLKLDHTLDEKQPIIQQLKKQPSCYKNKEQLESLKIKLSNDFIIKYDTKEKIEKDGPRMKKLADEIQKRWLVK